MVAADGREQARRRLDRQRRRVQSPLFDILA